MEWTLCLLDVVSDSTLHVDMLRQEIMKANFEWSGHREESRKANKYKCKGI